MRTPKPQSQLDVILKYIQPRIKQHLGDPSHEKGPFILGITGPQGSGKSTLAASIVQVLETVYSTRAACVSLDDFYHCHDDLLALKAVDPENKLFQTRGHAGSHDESLAIKFFKDVKGQSGSVAVPNFDKSAFNGEGDRAPPEEWVQLKLPIDVLIFEGWCVGFQALGDDELQRQWDLARATGEEKCLIKRLRVPKATLASHELRHLKIMNENMRRYGQSFMGERDFDYLIHLDATDLMTVYEWRIEQEHALWNSKGNGMTDEQVVRFVEGYMPAYELYLNRLRTVPFFAQNNGKERGQLRLLLDRSRTILKVDEIS
jgi:D-glycerate 3-kinase